MIYIFFSQFYHSVLINIQFNSFRQVISILFQVYHSAIIIHIASFRQVIYILFSDVSPQIHKYSDSFF